MSISANSAEDYTVNTNAMIELCIKSYLPIDQITDAVNVTGQTVVWGPQESNSWDGVSYSLMFVTQVDSTDDYIVVIRGTNPVSLDSWFYEDLEIGSTVAFNSLVSGPPDDAQISQATYNGLSYALKLLDPSTGIDMISFLEHQTIGNLTVTGHSLGGTLTPPMTAYLSEKLAGGTFNASLQPCSFAGLTPGNVGFNTYYNTLVPTDWPWRVHNSYDIAPLCWYDKTGIETIYDMMGPEPSYLEEGVIEALFSDAAGNGYAQPLGDQKLPGVFDMNAGSSWKDQAEYQHHPSTYQSLINSN